MSDIIPHLKHFSEDNIKTLGKRYARSYLRRCIETWRSSYGEAVADKMTAHIKAELAKAKG